MGANINNMNRIHSFITQSRYVTVDATLSFRHLDHGSKIYQPFIHVLTHDITLRPLPTTETTTSAIRSWYQLGSLTERIILQISLKQNYDRSRANHMQYALDDFFLSQPIVRRK